MFIEKVTSDGEGFKELKKFVIV